MTSQASAPAEALRQRPSVLVLSGHDPSGGAGLQADMESIASQGAHSMSVLSMITVQNCQGVRRYHSQPLSVMQEQLEVIVEERPIQAIKIGAISGRQSIEFAASLCRRFSGLPVVWDPVLAPTRGAGFVEPACLPLLRERLLPQVYLLTANRRELEWLAGDDEQGSQQGSQRDGEQDDEQGSQQDSPQDSDTQRAQRLCQRGCEHVLLTSASRKDRVLTHRLFSANGRTTGHVSCTHAFASDWRPGEYHGSGCTLSAAIAAQLARDLPLAQAIRQALRFVASSLAQADAIAEGQFVPRRVL